MVVPAHARSEEALIGVTILIAAKVRKIVPERPTFAPITTEVLTNAFTCGLAICNGIVANVLLSCENAYA